MSAVATAFRFDAALEQTPVVCGRELLLLPQLNNPAVGWDMWQYLQMTCCPCLLSGRR